MTPRTIVQRAVQQGLDVVAVCDHNSVGNARGVRRAARGTRVTVLPGIEVTSREEVHIVGIFAGEDDAKNVERFIQGHLPGTNDMERFGEQLIVDKDGGIQGESTKLLIGATTLSLEEVVSAIHDAGGLAIAAHVDRPSFSVVSQLGFVPRTVAFDALGLSFRCVPAAEEQFAEYGLPLIRSSDAHFPEDIGRASTRLMLDNNSFGEIAMALRGQGGRRVVR